MEKSRKIAKRLLIAFSTVGVVVVHSIAVDINGGPIITGQLWDATVITWLLLGIAALMTWGITLALGERQREIDNQDARDRADLATVIRYSDHRERSNAGGTVADINNRRKGIS